MKRRHFWIAGTAIVVTVAFGVRADEGTLILMELAATAAKQLNELRETLKSAKGTYDETKQLVGYARDAQAMYESFRALNADMLGTAAKEATETALPEVGYFRRELDRKGPWAQGNGDLARIIRICFMSSEGCLELKEPMSTLKVKAAIRETFGQPPAGFAPDVDAMDSEAAVGISSSVSKEQSVKLEKERANKLMEECTGTGKSLAACQAAGSTAQIQQLNILGDIEEQLATSNRLSATQLAAMSAERKRELVEAEERRAEVMDSATRITGYSQVIEIKTVEH